MYEVTAGQMTTIDHALQMAFWSSQDNLKECEKWVKFYNETVENSEDYVDVQCARRQLAMWESLYQMHEENARKFESLQQVLMDLEYV